MEFSTVFSELRPDMVIVIADRYETLAAAIAASYMNIILVHTQGGETTGSIDESVRHATTKLAHIHFPASLNSKKNIIRMGENPEFLQSFWINDDVVEVGGIDARVSSSGILTVSIPRKEGKRTRIVPSLLEPIRQEDTMKEEAVRPLKTEALLQQNKMTKQYKILKLH